MFITYTQTCCKRLLHTHKRVVNGGHIGAPRQTMPRHTRLLLWLLIATVESDSQQFLSFTTNKLSFARYWRKVLAEIGLNIAALEILVSLYSQSPLVSCSRVYSFFFRASRPRFVTMSCKIRENMLACSGFSGLWLIRQV